jgi:acyl-CoA synthetase (AMP-forming)/AMP-acid ligase II
MLKICEIPVPADHHPKPPNPCLPKHEFTIAMIAPKGAGKTTLIVNILKFYAKYFHQIIVFSPSIKNDEKWDYAKNLVLLKENKPLKKIIRDIEKSKDSVVLSKLPTFLQDGIIDQVEEPFTGKIPEENFIEEYTPETLIQIKDQQQEMIDFLKEHGHGKHKADRMLIIFDDPVGSRLFSSSKQDPFKSLNSNHRHLSTSIIMISQAYKEIPKTIRTNFSCLILFKIDNDQEKKVIYEEYSMGLTREKWLTIYNRCTRDKHSFLFYNMQQPDELRIMKCFRYVIDPN